MGQFNANSKSRFEFYKAQQARYRATAFKHVVVFFQLGYLKPEVVAVLAGWTQQRPPLEVVGAIVFLALLQLFRRVVCLAQKRFRFRYVGDAKVDFGESRHTVQLSVSYEKITRRRGNRRERMGCC